MDNRLKEHSRKPTAKTPNPNTHFKHSVESSLIINYEDIEVIDRADSNFKLCIKGCGGSVGTSRLSFDISTQYVEGSIPGPDVLFRKNFQKENFPVL